MKIKNRHILVMIMFLVVLGGCSSQVDSIAFSDDMNIDYTVTENSSDLAYSESGQDLKEIQTNILNEMMDDFNSGDYTIKDPYVNVNPFSMNTLSAYVIIPVDEDVTYEFTVDGKGEVDDFVMHSDVVQSDQVIVPVFGLYEDYDNEVTIDLYDSEGDIYNFVDLTITTEQRATDTEDLVVETINDQDELDKAFNDSFIFTSNGCAYDAAGNLRSDICANTVMQSQRTQTEDGHYLIANNSDHMIYDVDQTGYIMQSYNIPDGFKQHHDMLVAENGKLYALIGPSDNEIDIENGIYEEGQLAVYDTETGGEPIDFITLDLYFLGNKVNDDKTLYDPGTDNLHLNSVEYYEPTNTLIFSSQTQNMLFGIDADSYDLLWTTAGEEQGEVGSEVALTQTGDFIQSNGQHNAHITTDPQYDDGDDSTIEIMLFDNNYCVDENYDAVLDDFETSDLSGDNCVAPSSSSLLVYRIDTEAKEVSTIGEVDGSEDSLDHYSSTRSSWFISDDAEYSYVTFANEALFVIYDDEYNEIATYSALNDEQFYRANIISNDRLVENSDQKLEDMISNIE